MSTVQWVPLQRSSNKIFSDQLPDLTVGSFGSPWRTMLLTFGLTMMMATLSVLSLFRPLPPGAVTATAVTRAAARPNSASRPALELPAPAPAVPTAWLGENWLPRAVKSMPLSLEEVVVDVEAERGQRWRSSTKSSGRAKSGSAKTHSLVSVQPWQTKWRITSMKDSTHHTQSMRMMSTSLMCASYAMSNFVPPSLAKCYRYEGEWCSDTASGRPSGSSAEIVPFVLTHAAMQ